MAGNEIAQLAAVIKLNDGNVGQKLEIIKKGLGATDQKFNSLTKAVNDSAVKVNTAKIALDKYKASLGDVKNATAVQKAELDRLNTAYTQQRLGLAQSTLELKKYNIEQQKAATEGTGLTGVMSRMGLTASGVLVGGLLAVTTALAAITVSTVKTAGDFEQLAVSFDVLIGNSTKAAAFTNELINLANTTPMTTEGLAKNAQMLLAMGESLQNVIPDLKMLGDISGGNQEKMNSLALVFGQVGATGRLTGDNLRQMTELGFNPLNIIAQKTGETMSQVRDRMEDGKVSFSEFKDAMVIATSQGGRFYGMMNKQSQTLQGRLSTLADKISLIAKNIGDMFLPSAKKAVDIMIKLSDGALRWANSLRIANSQMNAMGVNDLNTKLGQLKKRQEELNTIPKGTGTFFTSAQDIDKERVNTAKSIKYAQDRIKILKQQEKEFNAVSKSTGGSGGFVDSTKDSGTGKSKKTKTKKGKSAESILSDRIQMIQAQSDFEIAQNDFTEEQVLLKKIATQQKITALYKKGSTDYIQSKTLELEYANQIEDLKTKKAKEEADKKKELTEKAREEEQKAAEKVAGAITDSLKSAIEGTKSLSEAFKDMLATMAINLVKSGLEKKLTSLFQGSSTTEKGGTGVLSNALMLAGHPLVGGIAKLTGFANGGNPPVNKPFMVGERGPELMQVGSSSKVWSNKDSQSLLGSNQTTQQPNAQPVIISNQINVKSLDPKEAANVLMENKQAIQKIINDGVKYNQGGMRDTIKGAK